jgi:sec-independent protein translocase protein TatA
MRARPRVFGSLGLPEILFILVLALLLFGPRRLPEIGRTIGKGLSEFRRATNDLKRSIESEIELEQPPRRPAPVPPTAASLRGIPSPVPPAEPLAGLPAAPEEPLAAPDGEPDEAATATPEPRVEPR